ncbi:serine/threonine protein kinase [Streptomyces sp. CA-106110]|uniref:serine/threonine protein kinase n=1 Tax=Streptomyces sp. CA-106110 TaxID=3240044 RepID=UPI003D91D13A
MTRPWRVPGSTEVRELHDGRCGRTALARVHGESGGLVVVRYVPAGLLIHRRRAEAFQTDLERLAGIDVPEVVRLRRYVKAKGFAAAYSRSASAVGGALVSDAVEGVALSRVLEVHGRLRASAALVVFHRILRALAAASDRELVHGDLRPAKVLIDGAGAVTVSGFGLAALTAGAPEVRAPELWRGDGAATPAADVYAAACVFHMCLTGDLPFPVVQLFSLMARHTTAPVPMTAVPGPLRPLLADGLTKNPALRPGARTLASAVERVAVTELGPHWKTRGTAALRNLAAPLLEELPPPVSTPLADAERATPSPTRSTPPPRPQRWPRYQPQSRPQRGSQPQDQPRPLFRPQSEPLFRPQPQPRPQYQPPSQARSQLPPRSRARSQLPPRSRPPATPFVGRRRVLGRAKRVRGLVVAGVGAAAILYGVSQLFGGDGGRCGIMPQGRASSMASDPPSTAQGGVCPAAGGLSLSPSSGDIHTRITVSGSGVVANGKVEVTFYLDSMGSVPTDSRGCFRATFAIPDQEFYGSFPGSRFDVRVAEYSSGGDYHELSSSFLITC